ncbi:MAG: glycoside hydrolase family 65 protein [Chitinispirillaceae bacterium]|nr:glycoside hydrolase family 65 protein [Chitinispirillaceae bacterium]
MEQVSSWKLVYNGFDPAEEGLREALCTLGNGYFGTRGAAVEAYASDVHYPGMYIAGVYNRLSTRIAGRTVYNEDLVNCPNWLFLSFKIGDDNWFWPSAGRIIFYRRELNMRSGVLHRTLRFRNMKGQITLVESSQIVHMGAPHYGAISYRITPENYSEKIHVRARLDGTLLNSGIERYRQLNSKHLQPVSLGRFKNNGMYLTLRTAQSKITVSEAATIRLFADGKEKRPMFQSTTKGNEGIGLEFSFTAQKGTTYLIEKVVAVYTSIDKHTTSPEDAAILALRKTPRFDRMFDVHRKAWEKLWNIHDITVTGDTFAQCVLRLHTFHLLQTISHHNDLIDAGMPARGLHGEGYHGHVFWDELFAMPQYDLHMPHIAQALLKYRYRRLPRAREYAKANGYKGAMFPWQSGLKGTEETQALHLNPMSGRWGPDYSRLQRHVSFAIGYDVWRHWERSGDRAFLAEYGAEMLLSIARFCASLVTIDPHDGRYHTVGIIGPDEFHEKLPGSGIPGHIDNAYSNVMIVWVLRKALELPHLLPASHLKRLMSKLSLRQEDLDLFGDITKKMAVGINNEGIISQFSGYFRLKELDWQYYRRKYGNIQRMDRILKKEGDSPDNYKVSKQADVLMLFYLLPITEIKEIFHTLGYAFTSRQLRANFDYYAKRTSHGSTLSKVVHCMLAHQLRMPRAFRQWFDEVLASDIHDIQGGTTKEGIHCGVMGGSLDIVRRCIAGVNFKGEVITIRPELPTGWTGLKFRFCHRKTWVSLQISRNRIMITVDKTASRGSRAVVELSGKQYYLASGETLKIPFSSNP